MKAFKVTISGSYRSTEKYVDYSNITGVVPFNEAEIVEMHVRDRYARMWLMDDEKFKDRLQSVREVYIDNMEETEADFSFVGKDIRDMTQKELQDLATAKDLRGVPLYKISSEREARTRAYAAYSTEVLKTPVDPRVAGFNLTKQPPIIVHDGAWRKDTTIKLTNDEVMASEAEMKSPDSRMNRSELEQIAAQQNIKFAAGISDDKLYEKIYGAKRSAA